MPSKTDLTPINDPFLDRRIKLLPCQKERMAFMYIEGRSITSLAKLFKVNKRTVQFLLFPDRKIKNVADRKAKGGSKQYYDKAEHARTTKDHRHYKQEIKEFLLNEDRTILLEQGNTQEEISDGSGDKSELQGGKATKQ